MEFNNYYQQQGNTVPLGWKYTSSGIQPLFNFEETGKYQSWPNLNLYFL